MIIVKLIGVILGIVSIVTVLCVAPVYVLLYINKFINRLADNHNN